MKVKHFSLSTVALVMAVLFISCSVDLKLQVCESEQPVKLCFTRGVTGDGSGAGSIKSCSTASGTYVQDTEIVVEALPCLESGSYFVGWYDAECGGNLVSKEAKYSFTLKESTKLFARFETDYICFPDPVLDTIIRKEIGKAEGRLTKKDVAGITFISYIPALQEHSYGTISDLRGLEHLVNLNKLFLYGQNISDISPLSGLTRLTDLNLSVNKISDISPLSNLKSLQNVDLYDNRISDITPLSNLAELNYIMLAKNQIDSLPSLKSWKSVKVLNLADNRLVEVTPLAEVGLVGEVTLDNNRITDVTPLIPRSDYRHIQSVSLLGCRVSDEQIYTLLSKGVKVWS